MVFAEHFIRILMGIKGILFFTLGRGMHSYFSGHQRSGLALMRRFRLDFSPL
jgi:hypothetical protein